MLEDDSTLQVPEDAEEARRLINNDIFQLEERIRRLKTRLNTLAPIARLPPEVLPQIFLFYRDTSMRGIRDVYHRALYRDWVRVSHVCRQWRQVALDCPELWNVIQFDNGNAQSLSSWHGLQLERSKDRPLAICANLTQSLRPETRGSAALLLPRMSRLDVKGYTRDTGGVKEFLEGFADSNAPALRSISIQTCWEIPPSLFAGGTRQLQSIRLQRCNCIPVSSSIFGSPYLTHLELSNIDPHLPWSWLLALLQRVAKTLETLIIDHILPHRISDRESGEDSSLTILELSKLRQLSIYDTYHVVSSFLNFIRIPASTRLDLWISQMRDEAYYESLYATLSTTRSASFNPKCLLLTRGRPASRWPNCAARLRIEAWEDQPLVRDDCTLVQPPLVSMAFITAFRKQLELGRLVVAEPFFPMPPKDQFRVPGLSSLHLKSLFIQSSPSWSQTAQQEPIPMHSTFWSEISQLPELANLMISPSCVGLFTQYLVEDSLVMQADLDGVPSVFRRRFTALKVIVFDGYNALPAVDDSGRLIQFTFETLKSNIQLRAAIGSGLESLKFLKWEVDRTGKELEVEEYLSSFIDSVQQYGLVVSCGGSSVFN